MKGSPFSGQVYSLLLFFSGEVEKIFPLNVTYTTAYHREMLCILMTLCRTCLADDVERSHSTTSLSDAGQHMRIHESTTKWKSSPLQKLEFFLLFSISDPIVAWKKNFPRPCKILFLILCLLPEVKTEGGYSADIYVHIPGDICPVRTTSHEGYMSHEGDVVRTYISRDICPHFILLRFSAQNIAAQYNQCCDFPSLKTFKALTCKACFRNQQPLKTHVSRDIRDENKKEKYSVRDIFWSRTKPVQLITEIALILASCLHINQKKSLWSNTGLESTEEGWLPDRVVFLI